MHTIQKVLGSHCKHPIWNPCQFHLIHPSGGSSSGVIFVTSIVYNWKADRQKKYFMRDCHWSPKCFSMLACTLKNWYEVPKSGNGYKSVQALFIHISTKRYAAFFPMLIEVTRVKDFLERK